MPWKESDTVSERMKFITRHLDGESVTELCSEFGISRKTGHKIIRRFLDEGPLGLLDKISTPKRVANKTPDGIEQLILKIKNDKPSWGAAKIRERYLRKYPNHYCPCRSTFHAVLEKHGLTQKRRRPRRYKPKGSYLSVPQQPNDLWCADFKGHFKIQNGSYCYPLTISDHFSRFLFSCEALETVKSQDNFSVFERAFSEFGLPSAIRTDNGVPFSHPQALYGLTPLSVWWLRHGIKLERIRPGCPQQNGRHERMHRTLKKWMGKGKGNLLQQQEHFDNFIQEYNHERPHEALDMKTPAEVHLPSTKIYSKKLEPLQYPQADYTARINASGDFHIGRQRVYVSRSFLGQEIGITQQDDDIFQVTFMDYDLGFFDMESRKVLSMENPFVLTKL